MAVEHTTYTWDPVSAAWVHERGPQITPPPSPPDVHALQSYFFDQDSREWIRTVLAPMGRDLAARYQGAHKIPEAGKAAKTKVAKAAKRAPGAQGETKKRGNTFAGLILIVLLVLLGGVGVVASQSGLLGDNSGVTTTTAPESVAPDVVATPAALPSVSAEASTLATAAPTTPGGGGGGGGSAPVRTAAPAPVATQSLPPGLSTRLPDGTTVIYTGPTLVVKPQALAATLTITLANGRPASGSITVALGTVSAPAQIDGNGHVAVTLATTSLSPGQYPLQVIYQGTLATVTHITVR